MIRSVLLLFSACFLLCIQISAQQTVNGTITHDNIDRSYILHIPSSYDASEPMPLVFSFHGFTSNALVNSAYTRFKDIGEAEGFIVVHPQGTTYLGNNHWNVGGFTLGSTVDDVGFTSALLDELLSEYSIDPDRVYSTGMSNGGYMSFLLACQLSDRIAAIASVTGSMTPQTYDACNPTHPTPVLQIHGTQDGTVPYEGNTLWTKSIDDVLEYWISHNNCDTEAEVTMIPDTDSSDNSTVDRFVFDNGDNDVNTEHLKVYGGGHDWPGAFGNMDINASVEVWQFFSQYDINGKIGSEPTSTKDLLLTQSLKAFPNPSSNMINVETERTNDIIEIYSVEGELIRKHISNSMLKSIDISDLEEGMYILKAGDQITRIIKFD